MDRHKGLREIIDLLGTDLYPKAQAQIDLKAWIEVLASPQTQQALEMADMALTFSRQVILLERVVNLICSQSESLKQMADHIGIQTDIMREHLEIQRRMLK